MKVFFKGKEITGANVVGAQFAFWNNGRLSIRSENILQQIKIKLNPPAPVLDVSIIRVSRDVTKTKLLKDEESFKNGCIAVSWDILEKYDGAILQIIYSSSHDVEFEVDGVIEGQEKIQKITLPTKIETVDAPKWVEVLILLIPIGLIIIHIIGFLMKNKTMKDAAVFGYQLIASFIVFGFLFSMFIRFTEGTTPSFLF